MFCKKCKIWETLDSDWYCSWCGAALVDFAITFNLHHVYVGDLVDDLTLTLTHTGTVHSIEIQSITSSNPWLIPQVDWTDGLKLQVNSDIVIPIKVELLDLTDSYHEAEVVVTSSIGTQKIVLKVSPRPKFQISTGGEHTVLLNNVPDERMSGYLSVTRGLVTIESLTTDVPEWTTVEVIQPSNLPCTLDQLADNRLEFVFHVDEQHLLNDVRKRGQSLPAEYTGTLLVKLSGFEELRKEVFRVNCFLPPELKIPEAEGRIRLVVFVDKRGELDLTLQNGERDDAGRANLQIHEIRIDAPWLVPSGAITYPLSVASGQYHGLTLTVLTKNLGVGNHPAKVTFLTNIIGAGKEFEVFVDVDVRSMPPFGGVLAIDFGTTNSCCAFLDALGQVELIPIGERADGNQTTVSSAILYNNLFDDNVKDYRIGNGAYQVSFSSSFSAVRQVKRLLGKTDPLEITFLEDPSKRAQYLPREVATDILRRILERAEDQIRGRIVECTISHPSRFSLGQIADLKEAIKACGIEKIKTVHEPIAAALDFIRHKDIRDKYEKYHLMVFDFGGGTTDITLMHIQNEYQAEQQRTKISPEVLSATGDRWLGGENVTDIVMDLAVARCEEVLRARNPDALNVKVPYDKDHFNSQHRQSLARGNRNLLRDWAEAAKIAISTYGDDHQEKLRAPGKDVINGVNIKSRLPRSFQLAVIVDNTVRLTEEFFHDDVVPHQQEINTQLRPKLEDMADMMQRLAKHHNVSAPDIILLSGKSSALPVVREVMEEYFPLAVIEMPRDLKECVVRGACQLTSLDPGYGAYIKFKGARTAMTSRLGIRVNDPDTGLSMFSQVIDAGVPIGDAGLRERVFGIAVDRETQIRILENTSSKDDWLRLNGEWNRNITELKVSSIDAKLSEWEKKHDRKVSEPDLENAKIELVVTPTLAVKLYISIPGMDEPLEFEAEWGGG
jgi:molecular chaperone DnaK (HSP70)